MMMLLLMMMVMSLDKVEFLLLLHFKQVRNQSEWRRCSIVFGSVCLFVCLYSFYFSFFFSLLNVCNTVMMTWRHVEMSAVLFLYVCVQASKEIIKLPSRCKNTFVPRDSNAVNRKYKCGNAPESWPICYLRNLPNIYRQGLIVCALISCLLSQ